MKYKELKPIKETPEDYEAIEQRIIEFFRREIYLPLLKSINAPSKVLHNSKEDLIDAITNGKIDYYRGKFTGKFTAGTSKALKSLGAKWKDGAWYLSQSELPMEVRQAVSASSIRIEKAFLRMDAKLAAILPEEIVEKLKLEKLFDTSLWHTNKKVEETLKAISVPPKLTPERRAKIAEEYTTNMKRYIKDWTEEEIKELRKKVEKRTFTGERYDEMVKMIQTSYGVSQRKAKFLARQETNLLLTKYKEARYTEVGVMEYKWGCVHQPHDKSPKQHTPGNVRYYHGILEGKVFRWDNPPITDAKGKRNNPGEDFNCRCFARPIVKF